MLFSVTSCPCGAWAPRTRVAELRPVSPAANEEYYQLLMSSEKPACGADVPACTLEEIQSVTSEFVVKNVVSGACRPVFHRPPGRWLCCGSGWSLRK